MNYRDLLAVVLRFQSGRKFYDWLIDPWQGKDKQEASFRLFAHLHLIPAFYEYDVCDGNFNRGTIKYIV